MTSKEPCKQNTNPFSEGTVTPAPKNRLGRRAALSRLLSMVAGVTSGSWLPLRAAGANSVGLTGKASPSLGVQGGQAAGAGFFSPEQKVTVAALAEAIIPADAVAQEHARPRWKTTLISWWLMPNRKNNVPGEKVWPCSIR